MYLYFSDWTSSARLEELRSKGAPVGDRLIKVYASPIDPSVVIGRGLTLVEEAEKSFGGDEEFVYGERFNFSGSQLENDLDSLHLLPYAKKFVRAIFRFGNREDVDCISYGMEAQQGGQWVFGHPFELIHGISEAAADEMRRAPAIHLDIFSGHTLPKIARLVDLDDRELILSDRETVEVIRELRRCSEGQFWSRER